MYCTCDVNVCINTILNYGNVKHHLDDPDCYDDDQYFQAD